MLINNTFRILFVIVLILLTQGLNAQNIEWGNPQKVKAKNLYTQIIGQNSSGIYVLRAKDNDFNRDLTIEKYKQNLALEYSMLLPVNVHGFVERVLLFEGLIHVYISAKNIETGNIDLVLQKLDMNLKQVDNLVTLCSIPEGNYVDSRNFQIKTNANKSIVAIMFLTSSTDKNSSVLNIFGFNNDGIQKYGKQFDLPYEQEDVFITAFDCDNTGNTFILLDFPRDSKKRKSSDPRLFFLYAYYEKSDKMLMYEIGDDKVFIEELSMAVNNFGNSLVIAGLFSDVNSKNVDGYFTMNLDISERKIKSSFFEKIDNSYFTKLKLNLLTNKSTFADFYIRKIIPRNDGGLLVIAEKYYQTRQTYTYYINQFPQTATKIIHNYDEIVILSINPNGKLQYLDFVNKKQSSSGDAGYLSSFVTIPTTDFVYFIYNSEVNSESDVMMSFVNYEGKLENKIVLKSANYSSLIIPAEAKLVEANTALICTIRDKRFTLMRLSF